MHKILTLFLLFVFHAHCHAGINAKAAGDVLKVVVSGLGAAASVAEGTDRWSKYQAAKKHVEKMTELEGYGSKAALYSIDFDLDPKKNAIYWADYIGKPDVYVVIEIEGYGSVLVPSLQSGYTGGRILKTVAAGNVKPGSKIRLYFLDDDMLSDSIWNSILQTKVEFFIGAEGVNVEQTSDKITQGLRVGASAGGKISLLDHKVEIDQPDLLADANFNAPQDKTWKLNADIFDSKSDKVGTLSFSKIDEVEIPKYGIFGSIFFYGAALVFGLIFIKYFGAWKPQASIS